MGSYWVHSSLIYTNSPPHIGHLYELVIANSLCECIKTWHKAKLVVGADDHGAKIQNSAKTKRTHPTKVSNLNSNRILALCSKHRINVKDWISTSFPRHVNSVLKKVKKLNASGLIRKLNYCGWYSPQSDCYCGSNNLKFSKNEMYCVDNAPTEWTEEQGVFITLDRIKHKLVAIYRANLVLTPCTNANSVLEALNLLESVCITRSKTTNYGIKVSTGAQRLVLWVWVDAILAYVNTNRENKAHIIGKDVTKFHLAHYAALTLLLKAKLPKLVLQHSHVNTLQVKVSKTLKNQPNVPGFRPYALYYYLCTRPPKADIEFNESELTAAFARLANNAGNLIKRVISLLASNQLKLSRLTVSDWIIMAYVKQLPITFEYLVKSFRLSEVNDIILSGTTRINTSISNYKLWRARAAAGHKMWVYSFATKRHIGLLKFAIRDKASLAVLNINKANTDYMPFPKQSA